MYVMSKSRSHQLWCVNAMGNILLSPHVGKPSHLNTADPYHTESSTSPTALSCHGAVSVNKKTRDISFHVHGVIGLTYFRCGGTLSCGWMSIDHLDPPMLSENRSPVIRAAKMHEHRVTHNVQSPKDLYLSNCLRNFLLLKLNRT